MGKRRCWSCFNCLAAVEVGANVQHFDVRIMKGFAQTQTKVWQQWFKQSIKKAEKISLLIRACSVRAPDIPERPPGSQ